MRRWVVAALLAALLPACSSGGDDGPAVPAARAADLAALTEALAAHPEPPAVGTQLEELRRRAGEVDDDRWLVELMRLTAGRDRDGHTGVFPLAQPGLELWPLQLYDFADGWRVVAALPPYEELVGGRVDAVGDLPVEQAAQALADLVPRDNDQTVRARVAQLLVSPAVLRGAGLRPSITVAGTEVVPDAVPAADFAEWSDAFYPLVVPRLPPVPDPALGVARRGSTVVLTYAQVVAASGDTTLRDLASAVRADGVRRVVVDLRHNSGGENGSYPPLLEALKELPAGSVRLLTSRTTFSAATNFVAEVLSSTDALVVGEPMGGAPNMWGDAREVALPGTGAVVHVATRLWELGGVDLRSTVPVDVEVPVTWADWSAGRDRVLERAVVGEGGA